MPDSVRSLTHDLRNPLTALKSCLELLLKEEAGPLNEDQKRFLGLAGRNIDRLDRMVTGMLIHDRPEPGPAELTRREVDLGRVLSETVSLHRTSGAAKGLEVDAAGIPVPFLAVVDSDLVTRILDNVLGNALKFTPSGGLVRVWLEEGIGPKQALAGKLARRYGLPLATFNLVVEDNGPGLSPAVQRRVFEPFNSGSGRKGSGLGLSITRELAESHGGRVRLASLPGRGTTVWLKLPRDPLSDNLLKEVDLLQESLCVAPGEEIPPVVGVIDLRGLDLARQEGRECLDGFRCDERSGQARCRELVPGLWVAPVTDPVNWNRRWVLHAARRGCGLEATRWEFLDPARAKNREVTGKRGEHQETMVNQAPSVPIIF